MCCFQIRRIVASLTPCALAIVRVLQCVASEGVVCRVASTTALILRGEILGIRPGRGASFSKPAHRKDKNRCRHSWTVGREMPNSRAMMWLKTPAAAIWMICARCTNRAGTLLPRAQSPRVVCSSLDNMMACAVFTKMNIQHKISNVK